MRVCGDACRVVLLGLFEAFARGSQEGALGRGQGAVGLGHQVRVGRHHGFPARRLHHLGSMAGGRGEKRRKKKKKLRPGKMCRLYTSHEEMMHIGEEVLNLKHCLIQSMDHIHSFSNF